MNADSFSAPPSSTFHPLTLVLLTASPVWGCRPVRMP